MVPFLNRQITAIFFQTTKMLSSCHKKVANSSKDGRNDKRLKYHMGYHYLASCKKVVCDINK